MSQPYRNTEKQSKPNPIRLDPTKRRLDLYWPRDLVKAIRLYCEHKETKPSAYIQDLVRADLKRNNALRLPTPVAAEGNA
jgi:hypothetical protein